jgi:hypothetical protein
MSTTHKKPFTIKVDGEEITDVFMVTLCAGEKNCPRYCQIISSKSLKIRTIEDFKDFEIIPR